jgi:hypothetical protein
MKRINFSAYKKYHNFNNVRNEKEQNMADEINFKTRVNLLYHFLDW